METTDGSSYELEDRLVYVTDVESEVTPEVKNVKGFTAPDKQTVKVIQTAQQLLSIITSVTYIS